MPVIVINILLTLLFGSDTVQSIISGIAGTIGFWMIFQKCGVPAWHALIPAYKEYALARCVDQEMEGRVIFVIRILYSLYNLVGLFYPSVYTTMTPQGSIMLVLLIIQMIYHIRVRLSLIELFGRKKIWIVLWMVEQSIPALIWGVFKQFQPKYKVQDITESVADYFSGSRAAVLDEGLTVNLEERTTREFFKKKYLLRDMHMYIKPGRMVLLLGGSGAGKTTLLNAVNGYEKARAEIVLNGRNVYRDYKKMQYDIGFVPQQDLMRGSDTVLNTLSDAAKLRLPESFTKADRSKRVDEVMGMFGLKRAANTKVDKMSGGQRKRLSIAMEFISNPSLFILDEPDSGLDGVMARELMQQLRSIADQGKIVIVITHTPDRVIDLFDDVIVLARDSRQTGRLAFFGTTDEAKAFFERDGMEKIVMCINRADEGGEGRADEFIRKYAEVQHG